jgi:hypothetical protein
LGPEAQDTLRGGRSGFADLIAAPGDPDAGGGVFDAVPDIPIALGIDRAVGHRVRHDVHVVASCVDLADGGAARVAPPSGTAN